MQSTCLNCGAVTGANFCATCGQSTRHKRLITPVIIEEYAHAFLHADRSIFKLIAELTYKPGIIARDYVQGKRKSHYNPISFLVLIVAFSTFIILASGTSVFGSVMPADPITSFAQRHFNLIIFLTVPLLSLSTWLFARKQYNFAECSVLVAYTSGERSLFHLFVFVPFQNFFPQYFDYGLPVYMLLYFCYYAVSYMQFTGTRNALTFLKGFLAAAIMQLLLTVLFTAAYTIFYFFLK